VAWGQQGPRPWGLPDLKGVRRSRPSHLDDRPIHPHHLHTLLGIPHMASLYCRRRRRRNSLVLRKGFWPTSTSTIKHSTIWVSAWIYIICWGTLDGCNSPTGCQQTVDAKRAPSANHTASRTSWLYTRKESRDVPVNFSWKLTKDKAVKYQSLELAGWYQTVPYLRLRSQMGWHIAIESYLPMNWNHSGACKRKK
jgi:hypothetical protein